MREILFRGKTPGGWWVYGDHIKDRIQTDGKPNEYIMIRFFNVFEGEDFEDYEFIIPETIGQYAGKKDHHGKMIFEGDILRSVHFESIDGTHYLHHIVEWSDRLSGWYMKNINSKTKDGHAQAWVYFKNANIPEIIGNIHDNPELLK